MFLIIAKCSHFYYRYIILFKILAGNPNIHTEYMSLRRYSIMENIEIINGFKKKDDWLGILQFYDLQAMGRDIPADILTKEQNEILFAAKHWCDDMQRRANSKPLAEQALRGYIWTYIQSEKLRLNPKSNKVLH